MTFLKILLDVLGITAIIVFGSFVLVLLADLFLSALDKREGIFFNKNKKKEEPVKEEPVVEEYNPEEEPVEEAQEEPVEEYNPEDEEVAAVIQEPEEEVEEEEDDELTPILEEVTAQALKELEDAEQKQPKVFTFKPKEEEPVEEPVEEETEEVDEEKQALEARIKELEEARAKDLAEMERLQEEMRKTETVVVEPDDSRKYANIARMNATLNRIKRNTEKLANQEPEKETTEVTVTEEVTMTKPRFQREYYVDRLAKLEAELKDSNRELRQINKEYLPVARVHKVYDRDITKLRRKEAIVAKQKLAIYGVNKSGDVDPKKKEKLDQNVKELKELKDSIFECEKVIKANEDRFPALEKSHKLILKQIKRINDDINSTKESIEWYDNNTETIVTTTTTTEEGNKED